MTKGYINIARQVIICIVNWVQTCFIQWYLIIIVSLFVNLTIDGQSGASLSNMIENAESIDDLNKCFNLILVQKQNNDASFTEKFFSDQFVKITEKAIELGSDELKYKSQIQKLEIELVEFQKWNKNKEAINVLENIDSLKHLLRLREYQIIEKVLEEKYQKNNQQKEIIKLNALNDLDEFKYNQRSKILRTILVVSIILLASAFLIWLLYKKLKNQKLALNDANNEKEILLKEIHHRVKNNLQVISSLLSLQSKYIANKETLTEFKQGQDRVHSMVLIHQDLYQSDNLKGVYTTQYFENLIDNLVESYDLEDEECYWELDSENLLLDIDTMIPLGLIMNEVLSKFLEEISNRKEGNLYVVFKKEEDSLFLEITDSKNKNKSNSFLSNNTFGFELIQAFAMKLKASFDVKDDKGLSVQMKILNYTTAN